MKLRFVVLLPFIVLAPLYSCSQSKPGGDEQAVLSYCPAQPAQETAFYPLAVNQPPRAYYQTVQTTVLTTENITLFACDPDLGIDYVGLSWEIYSEPVSGSLDTFGGSYDGSPFQVAYTAPSQAGTDRFMYRVYDGTAWGNTAEVLITVLPAAAQAGSTWVRTYSLPATWIQGRDIGQAADGGFILAGTSGWDFWAARLDSSGELQWMRTLGDNNTDASFGVEPTSDGGSVLAGQSYSLGAQLNDIFIVKLDSSGSVAWEKTFGTVGSSVQEYSYSIQETVNAFGSPDGYIVGGYNGTVVNDTADIVILRLALDGSSVWQRRFDGGANDVVLSSTVRQTADLGFIVAGMSASFTGSDYDAWLIKLNSDGSVAWQRTVGTSGPGYPNERVRSIRQTSDGGYILGGMTEENDPAGDYWVVKLDQAGGISWQRSFGYAGTDEAWTVEETSDGGYFVVGTSSSFSAGDDAWVLKLGPDATVQWQWAFDGGGDDAGQAGYETPDGMYVVTGWTDSFGSAEEAWVLKLDADGQTGSLCDLGFIPVYSVSSTAALSTASTGDPSVLNLAEADSSATVSTTVGSSAVICDGQ